MLEAMKAMIEFLFGESYYDNLRIGMDEQDVVGVRDLSHYSPHDLTQATVTHTYPPHILLWPAPGAGSMLKGGHHNAYPPSTHAQSVRPSWGEAPPSHTRMVEHALSIRDGAVRV